MTPTLPDEARELGSVARSAFASLGGIDLARRAEVEPGERRAVVAPLLADLGVDELDPRAGDVASAAAAALAEAAGAVALPYPIAAMLVRDATGRPTAAVPAEAGRVDHADVAAEWNVGTLAVEPAGGVGRPVAGALGTPLGPFVGDLEPAGGAAPDLADLLLQQTLVAWTVLGAVGRAVALAVDHVTTRVQFGKPIAAFQAVQFQVADAAVAVAGLRELAAFTLWRVQGHGPDAFVDVLALRLHSLEVARSVFRTCQQLHGAAGVCDEYDVSVLVRHTQPALRLPFGVDATADALSDAIARDGFVGLFPHGGALAHDRGSLS